MDKKEMEDKISELFSGYLIQNPNSLSDAFYYTVRDLGKWFLSGILSSKTVAEKEEADMLQTAFIVQLDLRWLITISEKTIQIKNEETIKMILGACEHCFQFFSFMAENRARIIDEEMERSWIPERFEQTIADLKEITAALNEQLAGRGFIIIFSQTARSLYNLAGNFMIALLGKEKMDFFEKEFNAAVKILNEIHERYRQNFISNENERNSKVN